MTTDISTTTLESAREDLLRDGWCVLPDQLSDDEVTSGKELLWAAAQRQKEAMAKLPPGALGNFKLDPNDSNVRVNNLASVDKFFVDLLFRPNALSLVDALLEAPSLIGNFSANIALPGSGPMKIHSDQSLVVPGPWFHPWAINIIWCFDDVYEANGATRYLPGSHKFTSRDEVPEDISDKMVAFEAPKGSFVAMDGRLWHTSGANVTEDKERAMLFAYYATDFLRTQVNWQTSLPESISSDLTPDQRTKFGLDRSGNQRLGRELTNLNS